MSRPLRIEFPGALYHVMTRGNAGGAIFSDDEDRKRYAPRPSLEEVFGKRRFGVERVVEAHNRYRYTLKEIGDHLGIHYATVSRIIKKVKGAQIS